ncbi:Nitrogen regulation protein ntrY [Liberibacter crescens BT-1]|uniref:histidine kinase n=1 Tax=Liberibacter crescens (strain BT-1) TaxID=1215343 RepID=L0EUE1_LIBCB|nr:PAS domain-containing sensor histidine kinase [Liberibacter crescens]AGA64283.1 Nitrogen regulation protein ntrY [Liberibacter crescens BT-1]AMC12509.1 ATPase [Liberibacter crescens]
MKNSKTVSEKKILRTSIFFLLSGWSLIGSSMLAGGALLCAITTLIILLGLTPISPTDSGIIVYSVGINAIFSIGLILLIIREVRSLLREKSHGRAAARLHIRMAVQFSLVAIIPAILVAIFAFITLNTGLDRWFSIRTQSIVQFSKDVAAAYIEQNAFYLQSQTETMAEELERNHSLFNLNREKFIEILTNQARNRGLLGAFLVKRDGSVIIGANIKTEKRLPAVPSDVWESVLKGKITLIPPGITNLVGAICKLNNLPGAFLYTMRIVDFEVMQARELAERNIEEYKTMDKDRTTIQIAFAVVYLTFVLFVLVSAIWTAIAVADRLVRPIRLLISAANSVTSGNLSVIVPVEGSDDDINHLSHTFNKMIVEIRSQQDEILKAKSEVENRRRFIEAVLSGVNAAVIGIESNQKITIVNRFCELLLRKSAKDLIGKYLFDVSPEISSVFVEAKTRYREDFCKQISFINNNTEHTISVHITNEEDNGKSYVITIDDITDLVVAQRSNAWADVARRIAHEIKNPLTPIQLSAERIQRRYGNQINPNDRQIFEQCTQTIIRQVNDIDRMVDEFSSFTRMPKPSLQLIDLTTIINDAIFLREIEADDITFIRDLGNVSLEGMFDGRLLGQAFGNLIKNAVESIRTVHSHEERSEKKILVSAIYDKEHDYFIIDIIDNGRGLPVENRHRIFEPYVTMREEGTGLGLTIVKKIVEDHGGQLELNDAPVDFDNGRGAMIRVRLPYIKITEIKTSSNNGKEIDES